MSLAEIRALIQEQGDGDDMPVDFDRRLLAVMQRDHAKAVKLIAELNAEIHGAAELEDLELAEKKQSVFARLLVSEAEMRRLIDSLAQTIEEPQPETKSRRNAARRTPAPVRA